MITAIRKTFQQFFRFIMIGTLTIVTVWLCMFIAYVSSIPNMPDDSAIRHLRDCDAIIIFTGDRGRVKEGLRLYKRLEYRPAIMISGVAPFVNKNRVFTQYQAQLDGADLSRMTLDHGAMNTVGNIERSIKWADQRDYKKIVFVSSHYHFPRIDLLKQSFLNDHGNPYRDIRIINYPIAPKVTGKNWVYYGWVYFIEFHKYLVTLFSF
jgi:uncharacterized SAM-binding protein YcdF (DUF218 family)